MDTVYKFTLGGISGLTYSPLEASIEGLEVETLQDRDIYGLITMLGDLPDTTRVIMLFGQHICGVPLFGCESGGIDPHGSETSYLAKTLAKTKAELFLPLGCGFIHLVHGQYRSDSKKTGFEDRIIQREDGGSILIPHTLAETQDPGETFEPLKKIRRGLVESDITAVREAVRGFITKIDDKFAYDSTMVDLFRKKQ